MTAIPMNSLFHVPLFGFLRRTGIAITESAALLHKAQAAAALCDRCGPIDGEKMRRMWLND